MVVKPANNRIYFNFCADDFLTYGVDVLEELRRPVRKVLQ